MKIAVCIKQVPTREWQPRLNDQKTWIREADVSYEMNEPDAYALEEALRASGPEAALEPSQVARLLDGIKRCAARRQDLHRTIVANLAKGPSRNDQRPTGLGLELHGRTCSQGDGGDQERSRGNAHDARW